ncbi:hypothetical protein ACFWNL_18440 [Kitasatospora sp. NPDC058397]|uniref:hypothetical protein n=1 Tax=unclassified Kitasatospora TaxID=2633591 RepID=UPI0036594DF2
MTTVEKDPQASAALRRHLWMLACAPAVAAAAVLVVGRLALLPLADRPSRLLWVIGALVGFCYVVARIRRWVGRVALGTALAAEEVLHPTTAGGPAGFESAVRGLGRVLVSRVGPFPRIPQAVRRAVEEALARDIGAGASVPGPESAALLNGVVEACNRWADALDLPR